MQLISDPENTYRAIGRFIYEFSQLEYTLREIVAKEVGLHGKYFDAIIHPYDVALLCTVTQKVLIEARGEAESKIARELIAKVHTLNQDRIRVVHGLWVPSHHGGSVHHVPRSLAPKWSPNQAVDLETKADEACQLRAKIYDACWNVPLKE